MRQDSRWTDPNEQLGPESISPINLKEPLVLPALLREILTGVIRQDHDATIPEEFHFFTSRLPEKRSHTFGMFNNQPILSANVVCVGQSYL